MFVPESLGSYTDVVVDSVDSFETAPLQLPTDELWIQQTLKGDTAAFGHIVQKYQSRFLAMAKRILHSEAEAEDVVGEAFIEAYRHLSEFQNRAKFSTWLYTIVMNHARNRLRHNRVLQWVPLETTTRDDDDHPFMNFAENGPSMETALDHKIQLEAVQKVLHTLPDQYRAIFTMHYFNGMLLQDIAKEINRPLGTVKAYLHRARKMLDKRLLSSSV